MPKHITPPKPEPQPPTNTPTNTPRFLSIISYLKHTYKKHTTPTPLTIHTIHINPLIEDHLQLLEQCQNDDERADVLHELYSHGYGHGKVAQLKRSKN